MSKSCIQIYYHLVWATKNRIPYLEPKIEEKLYRYIRALACKKGINLLAIGGTVDHIHLLIKTNGTITSEFFVRVIKFMTTKFINEETDCGDYFRWQRGSGVFSIHHSIVNRTVKYIQKQKDHHRKMTFDEELTFISNF